MGRFILTLDQGTTSSRAIVFDREGSIVSSGQVSFRQYYPKPGWVEHDPDQIWESQILAVEQALETIGPDDIGAVGITNQRETTVLWDRITGKPLHPAIVWQCRRTAHICDDLKSQGLEDYVRNTTGLLIDAYFSATKIKWILDSDPVIRDKAVRGEVCFGTVDSWLLYKLTGGRVHATDVTNASRTMLWDINRMCWDERLLRILDIPRSVLPEVRDSSGFFGEAEIMGRKIPVTAVAGDQQAALFGQTCYSPGDIKNTYGTGCFILCNTGERKVVSESGLLTTVAYSIGGRTAYALEGSVFNAGSAIQWLRDEMGMISKASECDELAEQVGDCNGMYFVPAFTGLGAPYWDMYARGAAVGMTRGTTRAHFARAVLESLAYQSRDVIEVMRSDSGVDVTSISADGGASASNVLMQFQADILGISVVRPVNRESTALGAAFLAGLSAGMWSGFDELRSIRKTDRVFAPGMDDSRRDLMFRGWKKAVTCAGKWAEDENR